MLLMVIVGSSNLVGQKLYLHSKQVYKNRGNAANLTLQVYKNKTKIFQQIIKAEQRSKISSRLSINYPFNNQKSHSNEKKHKNISWCFPKKKWILVFFVTTSNALSNKQRTMQSLKIQRITQTKLVKMKLPKFHITFDNMFTITKRRPTGNSRAKDTVYPEAPL
ncbi:unnamed protein product (macronuclear) [Paramecium tetraurelia]|uniref:Uncharacterized protein n=1 Tax=Paramecium tetraurelia TaxID=5888 RepID=A0DIH1_PARTE|nr:uncharacterized protein GSPATT00017210001 [Paramecium tetraurelia]CAK82838.1 unnamed protein product [Paramecium tetraurelia]|eukprot:XP_001450235.1 hypothetical protein (macronuclear) [Paramecium tetraurelia strain d4-2]